MKNPTRLAKESPMFRSLRLPLLALLCLMLLLPAVAQARRNMIIKPYTTARNAASHAGAYALSRNYEVRSSLGAISSKRVFFQGKPTRLKGGALRYNVATRKRVPGTTKPMAEVRVTVRKTQTAWRAYVPGQSRVKTRGMSSTLPAGWR